MKSRARLTTYASCLVGALIAVTTMGAMLLLHAVSKIQIVA
jgi:hypothetical protein